MPGNLAELRPLVFIAAFVGFTVLIVSMMVTESPEMFGGQTTGSSTIYTSGVSPMELLAWNSTYTLQLTSLNGYWEFTYGGRNIAFGTQALAQHYLYSETYDKFWIFYYNIELFKWYDKNNNPLQMWTINAGIGVPLSQLNADYASGNLSALIYTLKNSKTSYQASFGFNTTTYATPDDALVAGQLCMTVNQGWEPSGSSFSALGFISGLFLFSLPGVPVVVNALLWLMIFPALFYLAFIFVLKMLGAIFGGG